MTPAEIQKIRDDLAATTFTLPQFFEAIRTKKNYQYRTTPWYRALMAVGEPKSKLDALLAALIDQEDPPPPPPSPSPPPPPAPELLFRDGFENRNFQAFVKPAPIYGGRMGSCDCTRVCPGGTPDTTDPLDSFHPDGAGYFFRVTLRPECKSLIASCLNACEYVLGWPDYKLGKTEFLAHRVRVSAPYTPQIGWGAVISQFGYSQVKYNGLGLQLVGEELRIYCNLGYSEKGSVAYSNPLGYSPRGAVVPVQVGSWHDYAWEVKYATEYGTGGLLRLHHRMVGGAWSVIFDSRASHPAGVPTRQWGYGLGNDTQMLVDVNGRNVATGAPRGSSDKLGAYRDAVNTSNNLTVDHRKFCVAESMTDAVAYLDAPR